MNPRTSPIVFHCVAAGFNKSKRIARSSSFRMTPLPMEEHRNRWKTTLEFFFCRLFTQTKDNMVSNVMNALLYKSTSLANSCFLPQAQLGMAVFPRLHEYYPLMKQRLVIHSSTQGSKWLSCKSTWVEFWKTRIYWIPEFLLWICIVFRILLNSICIWLQTCLHFAAKLSETRSRW